MEQITLVKDAIHRPDEPRHFMEYKFPTTPYVAIIAETVIADSNAVLKLAEVGFHIYDPVIYFPLADARLDLLHKSEKSSHCPLKGDTNYFDFVAGETTINDIGWCYSAAFDFAIVLADYIAFDPGKVRVVTK